METIFFRKMIGFILKIVTCGIFVLYFLKVLITFSQNAAFTIEHIKVVAILSLSFSPMIYFFIRFLVDPYKISVRHQEDLIIFKSILFSKVYNIAMVLSIERLTTSFNHKSKYIFRVEEQKFTILDFKNVHTLILMIKNKNPNVILKPESLQYFCPEE